MAERIELPSNLANTPAIPALNARLRSGEVVLDWSKVRQAEPAELAALLQGLDLARNADGLGLDTVPDALADAVERACLPAEPDPTSRAVRDHLINALRLE